MGFLPWLLSAVLLLGACSQTPQGIFFNLPLNTFPGSLTTAHRLFYVGENLTLHCYKDSAFVGEVRFERGNDVISSEYVTTINATYARLDKPVTSADLSQADFICADENSSTIGKNGPIYTDYAPRNATNFKMIWQNKDSLLMSWNFGSDDFAFKNTHPKVIQINAWWSSDYQHWNNCTTSNNTACYVDEYRNSWGNVSVRVSVSNEKRGDSVVSVLPGLLVRKHAKPDPVSLTKVVALTSRSVILSVDSVWNSLAYKITYCLSNMPSKCSQDTTNLTDVKDLTVSGLHPSDTYSFFVQAKFSDGYFSEPEAHKPAHDVTMPEDAPTSAPEVRPGSFYLDLTSCSPTRSSAARLYIYFQEVAKEHQNGQIRNYTADVTTETGPRSVSVREGYPRTLKIIHLPCHEGFNVSVYASNLVGRSPVTLLFVPPRDKELHKKVEDLDLRLKLEDDGITAEWKSSVEIDDLSLLVYFCRRYASSSDILQCQEAIHSETVSQSNLTWNRLLPGTASADMLFGMVAVTSEGKTSGIVFSDCIYDPRKEVVNVPSKVNTASQVDFILVTWEGPPRCDASQRFIIFNYEIMVCVLAQSPPCPSYRVDGNMKSMELRKPMVSADTKYSVRVRANTSSGSTEYSAPVIDQLQNPAHAGLNWQEIAGIISGALVLSITLGVLVFFHCRDKFLRLKRVFNPRLGEKPLPDHGLLHARTPDDMYLSNGFTNSDTNNNADTTNRVNIPSLMTQNSDDSGYNQETPPASPLSDSEPLTEHRRHEEHSTTLTTTVHSTDSLHGDSFTNLAIATINNPPQDVNNSGSQDSSVGPYVIAATAPGSDNSISGDESIHGMAALSNQQMVFFIKCDPPILPSGSVLPTLPLASLPSSNEAAYVQLGVTNEQRAESAEGCDLDDISLQSEEADYTVTKILDPSSVDQVESISHSQPPFRNTNYVRLFVPDQVLDGPNNEPFGDLDFSDDEDRFPFDADHELGSGPADDPLQPQSELGVQNEVNMSSVVDIQSYVKLSPVNGARHDSKQADDQHDPVPEEELDQETAAKRTDHGYVSYPEQSQGINPEPASASDMAGPVSDLSKDFLCSDEAKTGLNLGYLPLPDQIQGPQLAQDSSDGEEEELESESSEQAEQGAEPADLQTFSGLVNGQQTVASSNGYVSHSSLPSALLPSDDCHSPASAAETEDVDEDSSDDDTSPHDEDGIDGIGRVYIENTIDESSLTDTDGVGITSIGNDEEVTSQTGGNSNGYVPWQAAPNQVIDTGSNPNEWTPDYRRLDSGYVSPRAEIGSSPVWEDSSPGGHPLSRLHSFHSDARSTVSSAYDDHSNSSNLPGAGEGERGERRQRGDGHTVGRVPVLGYISWKK